MTVISGRSLLECDTHYGWLTAPPPPPSVAHQSVLRDEVKEKLKWNVDRTSPTNKIRDLMSWTRDIMKDISYQRKILDNPIAKMFTKGW